MRGERTVHLGLGSCVLREQEGLSETTVFSQKRAYLFTFVELVESCVRLVRSLPSEQEPGIQQGLVSLSLVAALIVNLSFEIRY